MRAQKMYDAISNSMVPEDAKSAIHQNQKQIRKLETKLDHFEKSFVSEFSQHLGALSLPDGVPERRSVSVMTRGEHRPKMQDSIMNTTRMSNFQQSVDLDFGPSKYQPDIPPLIATKFKMFNKRGSQVIEDSKAAFQSNRVSHNLVENTERGHTLEMVNTEVDQSENTESAQKIYKPGMHPGGSRKIRTSDLDKQRFRNNRRGMAP